MTDETTPLNTEQGDPDSSINQSRLSIVDQIAAKREAEITTETGHDFAEKTDEKSDEKTVDPQDEQVAAALADDDAYVPAEMLARKVKLKVNGVETETSLEQLVRDAQKSAAATQRLNEANEILRQAQELRSETPAKIPPSPAADPSEETIAKVKVALQAVFNGDEDAAAKQLAAVLAHPAPQAAPTVNTDEVAQVVTRKLEEDSALKEFFGAYPKVAQHPYVQGRADELFNEFATQGNNFRESLMKAGEALYKEIGWAAEKTAPEPPTTTRRTQDLAARKAALDNPPSRTVSAATIATSPESSEDDRASIIREMAARRNPTIGSLQKAGR